jgi:hypothetical protein
MCWLLCKARVDDARDDRVDGTESTALGSTCNVSHARHPQPDSKLSRQLILASVVGCGPVSCAQVYFVIKEIENWLHQRDVELLLYVGLKTWTCAPIYKLQWARQRHIQQSVPLRGRRLYQKTKISLRLDNLWSN